jgi:hypothetical protein
MSHHFYSNSEVEKIKYKIEEVINDIDFAKKEKMQGRDIDDEFLLKISKHIDKMCSEFIEDCAFRRFVSVVEIQEIASLLERIKNETRGL